MEIHPTNKNEVAWSSWLPALGYALAKSKGPVVEIGIGHFSTPFLHEYCKGTERDLISVENDPTWLAQFANLESVYHKLQGTMDWAGDLEHVGVTFIDNSPGGEARRIAFKVFLPISEYVVVHDYHRENEEAIRPHLRDCFYKVFDTYQPPTLLASAKWAIT